MDRGRDRGKELRINHRIRIPEVRLIGADGAALGVVTTSKALELAHEAGLDLVEIAPTACPPVCKILDYGKYKYLLKKKAHEAKRKQVVIHTKEVKFRPTTEEHDLEFKLRHIKRFLEEGNKAKITVVFRGREVVHSDRGRILMKRILEELRDKAKVEQAPLMEGKTMVMVVAPV